MNSESEVESKIRQALTLQAENVDARAQLPGHVRQSIRLRQARRRRARSALAAGLAAIVVAGVVIERNATTANSQRVAAASTSSPPSSATSQPTASSQTSSTSPDSSSAPKNPGATLLPTTTLNNDFPPCTDDQTSTTFESAQGYGGARWIASFAVAAKTASPCTLTGAPQVDVLDSTGKTLLTIGPDNGAGAQPVTISYPAAGTAGEQIPHFSILYSSEEQPDGGQCGSALIAGDALRVRFPNVAPMVLPNRAPDGRQIEVCGNDASTTAVQAH